MSTLVTVAGKSFNGKFTAKMISDQVFHVTIANSDIVSLKSLKTLFDKYLEHMLVNFEQNLMVLSKQNFDLFDKNSKLFWIKF